MVAFLKKILSDIYYKSTKKYSKTICNPIPLYMQKNQANWRKAYIWPCVKHITI